jgi:hypothetical protein
VLRTINIHRSNTANVGDKMSSPTLYFDELRDVPVIDILGEQSDEVSTVSAWRQAFDAAEAIIIGGGGLLEMPKFEPGLARMMSSDKKLIFWGCGHNRVRVESWSGLRTPYTLNLSSATLVGTRDAGVAERWVPCVTAMSPEFDRKYEIEREVVFFANRGMANNSQYVPADFAPGDIMGNDRRGMDEIISFLASAETVVTSSYHGAYWATLLGRKVVAIPTSSKFYSLSHPVPLCHKSEWRRFTRLARSYPEALEECRAANIAFHRDVMNVLAD